MRIDELCEKAKHKDLLECDSRETGKQEFILWFNQILTRDKRHPVFISAHFKTNTWKIIPAEPKVLTVEEIVDSMNSEYISINRDDFLTYQVAIQITKLGHQNGRLERDLEIRPLSNLFKGLATELKFFPEKQHSIKAYLDKIDSALENLKPL